MSALELEFPERILVVEDDPTIRLMLARTFEPVSQVLQAEDGATALRMTRQSRPDFVVTDLMLPEVSGLALIHRLREVYWGASVPILVLTANTRPEVLLECFRAGADDFMVKPFSLQEIRVRVASIHVRQKFARDLNPLTGIPGNLMIERQVERRLERDERFALATLDIDHFKAFNDSRGFDCGDQVIRLLGELLNTFAAQPGNEEVFVGHVGGDDFVTLLHPDQVMAFAGFIHERFTEEIRRYYEPDELVTGSVDIVNRHGEVERVPLLSVSIGVVDTARPDLRDYRRIAQVASEVKHVAKSQPGNSLFIDRRRVEDHRAS